MELEQKMKSAILNNTSRRKRLVSNDLNELRKEEKQQRKEEKPKLYQEKGYTQKLAKVERQTFRIRGGRSTSKGGREAMEIYCKRTSTILGMLRARGFPRGKKLNGLQCYLLLRRLRLVFDYMNSSNWVERVKINMPE